MKSHRKEYIDVLRGIAVGCMLSWHTASSWIIPSLQTGNSWEILRAIGGMGAPLFLLLAGVSITLKKGTPTSHAGINWVLFRRGLQIIMLGYLLRLQMWLIDSGALFHPIAWQAYLPLLVGTAMGWYGLKRWPIHLSTAPERERTRHLCGWLILAALTIGGGYLRVAQLFPTRLDGLWRVDVLQIIGLSIALLTVLIAYVRQPIAWLALALIATLLALPLSQMLPGNVPVPLAAYIARWPLSEGQRQMAMFPLCPWLAYVLIGMALGTWAHKETPGVKLLALSILAGLTAFLIAETRSYIHELIVAFPIVTHTFRVAYRVCVGLALAGVAYAACRWIPKVTLPLRMFGQTSLLIYWVHLEFAFGKAASLFRPCQSLADWGWKFALLSLLMLAISHLRLNYRPGWLYSRETSR